MIKRLSALMLCLSMLVSAGTVFAEEESDFSEEKEVVAAIGLWDTAYDERETVSRAEFAKVVVELFLPYVDIKADGITYYADVLPEYEYTPYINEAAARGYMIGTQDKQFSPDTPITAEQAVVVLMRALGYGPIANANGGYSTGYLRQSVSTTLLKGLGGKAYEELTPDTLAKLIFNCFDVQIMDTVIGEAVYTDEKKTLLSMRDMYLGRGTITANSQTSLVSAAGTKDGYVCIDDASYREGTSGAGSYLGYNVNFVYREAQDDNTVLCVYRINKNNNVMRINAEDIEEFDFLSRKYTYEKPDGRQTTVSFAKDADIIYNGRAASLVAEELVPNSGYVSLIDNNNDGKYEVVIVISYIQVFVSRIDSTNGIIYDRDFPENNIDLQLESNEQKYILKDAEGKTHKLFELVKNDIISAAVSKDGEYIELIYSRNSVAGKIDSIDLSENIISIDGRQYSLAPRAYGQEGLAVGSEITAYLDFGGMIAAFENNLSDSLKFAYLLNLKTDELEENTVFFSLFTQDNKFEIIAGSDKLSIDLIPCKDKQYYEIYTMLANNGSVAQLIKYETDSEGKIKRVDTLNKTSAESSKNSLQKVPYLNVKPQGGLSSGIKGALTYYKPAQSFSYRVYLKSTTRLFYIPYDDLSNRDAYKCCLIDSLDNGYEEVIEAYNLDGDNRYADVVLMDARVGTVIYSSNSHFGIVKKIKTTVNDDNETVLQVHMLTQNGEEIVILQNADINNPDFVENGKIYGKTAALSNVPQKTVEVNVGDTVRYNVGDNNIVYGMQMVFDCATRKFYSPTSNSAFATTLRVTGGMIDDFSDDIISVKYADMYNQIYGGVSPVEYYPFSKCNMIAVDMEGDRPHVEAATAANIIDSAYGGNQNSWIIFYTKDKVPQLGVIYNGLDQNPNTYLEQEPGFDGYTDAKPYIGFVYPY